MFHSNNKFNMVCQGVHAHAHTHILVDICVCINVCMYIYTQTALTPLQLMLPDIFYSFSFFKKNSSCNSPTGFYNPTNGLPTSVWKTLT